MKTKKFLFFSSLVLSILFLFSACQRSLKTEEKSSSSAAASSSFSKDETSSASARGETEQNEKESEKGTVNTEATFEKESASKTEATSKITSETKKYEPKSEKKSETAVSSRLRLLSLGVCDSVMCAEVENVSGDDIEYCLLKANANGRTAEFVLSVLPKGERAVLFEKNKKKFSKSFLNASWSTEEEILFEEPLEKMEDTFEINCLDGALEIKNKTSADIDKTIYICYKTVLSNGLDGSVSFRMRLGKIKSGETKQLFSENVGKNSRVIYVKYGN